jgi:hypothetical protein
MFLYELSVLEKIREFLIHDYTKKCRDTNSAHRKSLFPFSSLPSGKRGKFQEEVKQIL